MKQLLDIDIDVLKQKKAFWTAKEIAQQPKIWRETAALIKSKKEQLASFLEPILALENLRIILTGAGTSAYVGDALAPYLAKATRRTYTAISTTDIVGNPYDYLLNDYPTLIISYARSGNSPESLAAVDLANQVISNCYHLVITCNAKGKLALGTQESKNAFSLIMPEGTLDESFAMTSSFTSMIVATLSIFSPDENQLEIAAQRTENLFDNDINAIKKQANNGCKRIVFLGAGSLLAIAREAALKCLELTAGEVLSYFESPLGFRHGPKSLINSETVIIILSSNDAYTKQYDNDLYQELKKDNQAQAVHLLDMSVVGQSLSLDDIWASLPYIVYCQILSFFKSLELQLSPDNPCPSGEVNRVVQGVTIYPIISK
ncbi:MAG: SIS domain-containing protein [Colwellia sp.]|nr:SIS domain-containing protein [Colwellia sp.]